MQGMLSDYMGVKEESKEFEAFKANSADNSAEEQPSENDFEF